MDSIQRFRAQRAAFDSPPCQGHQLLLPVPPLFLDLLTAHGGQLGLDRAAFPSHPLARYPLQGEAVFKIALTGSLGLEGVNIEDGPRINFWIKAANKSAPNASHPNSSISAWAGATWSDPFGPFQKEQHIEEECKIIRSNKSRTV